MSNLSDVSILLKTFLRDEKLFNSINAIRRNMPEIQMIIVDDGLQTEEKSGIYADLIREGHIVKILNFDSGFGAKSNAGIQALVRPFLLISSDDFSHDPPSVKVGITKMLGVLDRNPQLSIVSGRLANRGPYEFYFGVGWETGNVIEIPREQVLLTQYSDYPGDRSWWPCDVTVNYSLVRRSVFDKVRFDDEEIIGEGGHGAFFYDCKKANIKVAYVPGVEISEQTGRDSEQYRKYRFRACGPSRKCFEKRGIKRWVLGNGVVDWEQK